MTISTKPPKAKGVINPDEFASLVAEKLREDFVSPFVTAQQAARLLHLKHVRSIPTSVRRYYRDGKKGRPLFRREEVLACMQPR